MNPSATLSEVDAPPSASASKAAISQSEIEQILTQVESVNAADGGTESRIPPSLERSESVRPFDFPKLSPLSGTDMRPLRVRHEELVSLLGTHLSLYLGLEVTLQLSKLEGLPYYKFIEGMSNPTYVTMLKLPPLEGTGLLDIPPRLGLCMVDRELGGPGRAAEESAQIGKVEACLLAGVVTVIVSQWCAIWKDMLDIRPAVIGHEANSRILETSTPDTTMLVVGMETRISDVVEQMQFALPHHMLEPLIRKLSSGANATEKSGAPVKPAAAKWNAQFDELEIQVRAELPEIQLSAGEVAELKSGDILNLPPECMNQVRLRLANHPGFIGTLGTSNQRRAVKIEKCLK
jgi:flagellar motor switch protein FliM